MQPSNDIQQRFQQLASEAPQVEVNEKFTYSFEELWEEKDEEQKFIIPDMLPSCAVAVLMGEDGIGKTQIVVQLCLTIALNFPTFMELPVVVEHNRALIVATEDSRQKFIKAAAKQSLCMKPDLDPKKVHLDFTEGADFDNYDDLIAEIVKQLLQHAYALVVIDAMSDLFTLVDGEINSNTHARKIIAALQSLCAKYSTTVLIIHHVAKSKIEDKHKNGKLFIAKNDAQGAGAITQKPRTVLALTHDPRTITNNGQNYRNFLHVVKANLMSKFYVNNVLELNFDANTLLHHFCGISDRELYEKSGPQAAPGPFDASSTPQVTTGNVLGDRQLHEQRCIAAFQSKAVLSRTELVARLQNVYQVGTNKVNEKNGILAELLTMGIITKDGRNYKHVGATVIAQPVLPATDPAAWVDDETDAAATPTRESEDDLPF